MITSERIKKKKSSNVNDWLSFYSQSPSSTTQKKEVIHFSQIDRAFTLLEWTSTALIRLSSIKWLMCMLRCCQRWPKFSITRTWFDSRWTFRNTLSRSAAHTSTIKWRTLGWGRKEAISWTEYTLIYSNMTSLTSIRPYTSTFRSTWGGSATFWTTAFFIIGSLRLIEFMKTCEQSWWGTVISTSRWSFRSPRKTVMRRSRRVSATITVLRKCKQVYCQSSWKSHEHTFNTTMRWT